MEKRDITIIAVVVLIGLVVLVSSGFFEGITGEATAGQIKKCTDSDGGNKPFVKGTVTYRTWYGIKTYTDKCYETTRPIPGREIKQLIEYFCINDRVSKKIHDCKLGCVDGACVEGGETEIDGCPYLSMKVKEKVGGLLNLGKEVALREGEKVYEGDYMILGNHEAGGYIMEVVNIYNSTDGYSDDEVEFEDVLSGMRYDTVISAEGKGYVYVGGKKYDLIYWADKINYESADFYVKVTWPPEDEIETFHCDWSKSISNYKIELVSATDFTATIKVTDSNGKSETKEINKADSKIVNGIEIFVIQADENAATGAISAKLKINEMYLEVS